LDQETLSKELKAGNEIIGIDFADMDWNGLELADAAFQRCTFLTARFIETDLEDTLFEDCTFKGCGFPRAKLRGATFKDCLFFDAESKTGTDFSYAHMREVTFRRCNLSTSRFRAANLYEARFEDCSAQGCDFEKATFSHAVSGKSSLTNTSIFMRATNFDYADFSNLSFETSVATECSFRDSNLRNCDFKGADLSQTDLSGADTSGVSFEGADLRGSNLKGLMLGQLNSFDLMKIDEAQQEDLLLGLGIQVFRS